MKFVRKMSTEVSRSGLYGERGAVRRGGLSAKFAIYGDFHWK